MFKYQIVSNQQTQNGDLSATVLYTNGKINITESYPDEADPSTLINTINSRLAQLQAVESFVINNPINNTPSPDPIITVDPTPKPPLSNLN